MPLLVCLNFTHYGPKSSESGVVGYLITDSIDKLIQYVDKKYLSDAIAESKAKESKAKESKAKHEEDEEDEDEKYSASFPFHHFKEKPDELQRAIDLGLNTVSADIGYLSGSYHLLTEFYGGTDWDVPDDCHYGHTSYDWNNSRPITEEQSDVLVDLDVALDIRGFNVWWWINNNRVDE